MSKTLYFFFFSIFVIWIGLKVLFNVGGMADRSNESQRRSLADLMPPHLLAKVNVRLYASVGVLLGFGMLLMSILRILGIAEAKRRGMG
ncbi:hypothetical protein [Streptomyces sodiiphilus]|uniref:hypothetical protein n=1 Tax=Streptomyces sodiiphilus TaxID=226217 RepID=UPI0031DA628E